MACKWLGIVPVLDCAFVADLVVFFARFLVIVIVVVVASTSVTRITESIVLSLRSSGLYLRSS